MSHVFAVQEKNINVVVALYKRKIAETKITKDSTIAERTIFLDFKIFSKLLVLMFKSLNSVV